MQEILLATDPRSKSSITENLPYVLEKSNILTGAIFPPGRCPQTRTQTQTLEKRPSSTIRFTVSNDSFLPPSYYTFTL